ncbi:MAG: hypothetical protein HC915_02775 [Anaerolineae bacterium]|nr:hypothetical protein [Anaerolineae bacterium]
MPLLVGPVEFGSFTPQPRLGNPGQVMWRMAPTRSTQNRVGLKNPGARAAAAFLRTRPLPPVWGLNLAPSPGLSDPEQEAAELLAALEHFLAAELLPSWVTLNLSCPNTEDDPGAHQTSAKTRLLVWALVERLGNRAPLWVKVGPGLAQEQYQALLRACAEFGAAAIVATNTLPLPTPGQPGQVGGAGGGVLHQAAVEATALLAAEVRRQGYGIDVIGCGGALNRASAHDFQRAGATALQYWSALVYGGPLAGALLIK